MQKSPIFKQHFRALVRVSPLVCLSEHSITTAIRNTKKKRVEETRNPTEISIASAFPVSSQIFRPEGLPVGLDNILECNMRIGRGWNFDFRTPRVISRMHARQEKRTSSTYSWIGTKWKSLSYQIYVWAQISVTPAKKSYSESPALLAFPFR